MSFLALGIAVVGIAAWMKRFKTRQHPAFLALAALILILPNLSYAQGGTPPSGGTPPGGGGGGGGSNTLTGFTIGAYTLQSSYRVSTYQYNYTYTTTAANANSTPYNLVLGTLTSSNANTTVVSGSVEFGLVPASGSASGLTTFTIRQDRRYTFDPQA